MSERQDGIESRLRRLEDLEEIRQLFIDYGRALDWGDFTAYGKLFADEGELLLGPLARARGPAEIEATMRQQLGDRVGGSYHLISSPVITLEGDEAGSTVNWAVIVRDSEGKPKLQALGRHIDRLVRERGRWKFQQREGRVDLPAAKKPAPTA